MRPLDFMIVGAQKSGTTALATFLSEHPAIAMAVPKELHVFDDQRFLEPESDVWVEQSYQQGFAGQSTEQKLLGEATPIYMYMTEIADQLSVYNSELKLIVMLRDPVDRALSHYLMEKSRGAEYLPFMLALMLEPFRLMRDRLPRKVGSSHRVHSYRARGLYSRQLEALYGVFPRNQVFIVYNNDLKFAHDETLQSIFDFLGVESVNIEHRLVFAREETGPRHRLACWLLRQTFRSEYRILKQAFGINTQEWRRH